MTSISMFLVGLFEAHVVLSRFIHEALPQRALLVYMAV